MPDSVLLNGSLQTKKSGAIGAAKIPVWQEEESLGIKPLPGTHSLEI
jgi:hypothetical protein